MRKTLVAGNSKMHRNLVENKQLLDAVVKGVAEFQRGEFSVCAPYPYLLSVQSVLKNSNVSWGAQNVSQHEKGAYTGEVSTSMLQDFGCRYVIVGHSERRAIFNEDNSTVALKYAAVRQEKTFQAAKRIAAFQEGGYQGQAKAHPARVRRSASTL